MANLVKVNSVVENPQWQAASLFGCGEDPTLCWRTLACPCLTYREIQRNLYGPSYDTEVCDPAVMYCTVALLSGFHVLLGMVQRTEIREKYGLEGNLWKDGCTHLWCHCCALCQEARELRRRPLTPYGTKKGDVMEPVPITAAFAFHL